MNCNSIRILRLGWLTACAPIVLAAAARAQNTDLNFPGGGFATLQAAIDGATDVNHDGRVVVQIALGIQTERVTITRSNFILRGSGNRGTTVQAPTDILILPVIAAGPATNVTVQNLVVRGNLLGNAVDFVGVGNGIVRNVEATGALSGVAMTGCTTGLIDAATRSHDNAENGITIQASSAVTVKSSRVDHNLVNGVRVRLSSNARIESVTADLNTLAGVFIRQSSGSRVLTSTLKQNGGDGLFLRDNTSGLFTQNTITLNTGAGVFKRAGTNEDFSNQGGIQAPVGNNTVTGNVGGNVVIVP